jgi:two-component system cell cycle sensor histidine kinase/response regulator CckA
MVNRVLVVEDNPADVRLLQEALYEVGAIDVRLAAAGTLRQAEEQLRDHQFDVVLLDLSLPDTDGLDGLERLQQSSPQLPVLVLTGRNDADLAVRAVRDGAQDYLVKGQVDGHLLVRAMRYAAERKQVMRKLKESEERFRSLLENALDIITIIRADGSIKYASPATQRVLGYAPDELTGTALRELIHPEDEERTRNALNSLNEGGAASTLECRVRTKAGDWRVVEAIGRRLMNDPNIQGFVVNARDVTERKFAESRLREVNDRLQTVIETSPLGIFVLDLDGKVQSWNRAAEKLFGWPEAEVLGHLMPSLADDDFPQLRQRLELARGGENPGILETRCRIKDGTLIEVNIWPALLRNELGSVTGVIFLIADVTERRRLEEQFRQAQKMEAIGRLAGGVAHDFNNLLTVITGYSQMVMNRMQPSSPSVADMREVMRAADRAASLTRQLLALSRRQVVELTVLDVNMLVADMERLLQRIIGEDVRLVTELGANVGPVLGDRSQLELVLLNLAINARDAMPNGGTLTIETGEVTLSHVEIPQRRTTALSGRCVMMAVSDTGTGMDPQVRAQIFEPFFTTKEAGKGTGLGLSTSYGIVRQHGGDIWVDTEVGSGTTFKVYLPMAGGSGASPSSERPKRTAPPVCSATILLVEDDLSVANVMRDTLEMQGFKVLAANNPEQALDLAAGYPETIHLLLSDIVLQSQHGVELARQIRKSRPEIRVLFVSGYTGAAIGNQPVPEPGSAFLQKPFAPEVLAAKVREVLNEDTDGACNASTQG